MNALGSDTDNVDSGADAHGHPSRHTRGKRGGFKHKETKVCFSYQNTSSSSSRGFD